VQLVKWDYMLLEKVNTLDANLGHHSQENGFV